MGNKHTKILRLKTLKKNIEPHHSFTGSYKNGVGALDKLQELHNTSNQKAKC